MKTFRSALALCVSTIGFGLSAVFAVPSITTEPVPTSITVSGSATLTVAASGSGALSYQWYKYGVAVTGATNASLPLNSASLSDAGLYNVIVTDPDTSTATSRTVRVDVVPSSYVGGVLRPRPSFMPRIEIASAGINAFAYFTHPTDATQNKLYVAGDFTRASDAGGTLTQRLNILRFNADGTIDTSYAPPAIIGGGIRALYVQSDGKVVIGGDFSAVNDATAGQVTRGRIARLNANGSLDTSFVSGSGAGANGSVYAIAAQGSNYLVGGQFNFFSGTSVNRLVRISASTGTVDSTFVQTGTGFASDIRAIAVDSNANTIYVGGLFATYNGSGTNATRIARLGQNGGAIDATFATGTGFNSDVRVLTLQDVGSVGAPDLRLLVGGLFTTYNGSAAGTTNRMVRLKLDGTIDTALNLGSGTTHGFNSDVVTFAVDSTNRIYVGGLFTSFNGTSTNVNRLIRIDATGALDTTFNPASGATSTVQALLLREADSQVYVGGIFSSFNSTARAGFARLGTAVGALDSLAPLFRRPGSVFALEAAPGGKWYIGGAFSHIDDTPRSNFARLNADGTLDTFTAAGSGFNGTIITLAVLGDGRVMAGGSFNAFNGTNRNNVLRMAADGTLDTTFAPAGTGLNGTVPTLALQGDGKVVIGGTFTLYNGTSRNRIARLTSTGALDTTFDPGTVGFNGTVNQLALQSDGKILVAGAFGQFNGVTVNGFIRLTSAGLADSAYPATGTGMGSTTSDAVAIPFSTTLAGETPYVAGSFTAYNSVTRNRILHLNADGTLDTTTFGAAASLSLSNSRLSALALQSNGRVVTGGFFTTVNGTARLGLARFNADGSTDNFSVPSILVVPSSGINALRFAADGSVIAAATRVDFAEGLGSGTLFMLEAAPVPAITAHPSNSTTIQGGTATFTATATGENLQYQWFRDSTLLTGQTAATLTLNNVQLSDLDSYTVRVSNVYGSVTSNAAVIVASNAAPNISSQSTTVNAVSGATATLTVNASGAALGYQWRRGGIPLAGQTGASLVINPVKRFDADIYDVVINSGIAVTVSQPIRLTVAPVTQPAGSRIDSAFSVNIDSNSQNSVNKVAVDGTPSGNRVVVAGEFRMIGTAARNRVARFNADGTLDTTFVPQVVSPTPISALAVQSDHKVLVGGTMNTTAQKDAKRLVRMMEDGSLDTAFNNNMPIVFGNVLSIVVQPDGKILAAGVFSFNPDGIQRNRIVRLMPDGTLDTSFFADVNSTINAMALQADGKILIGGSFTAVNNATRTRIARLEANGTLDTTFTPAAPDSTVLAIAQARDGSNKIYIGGQFNNVDGNSSARLARLTSTGAYDALSSLGTGFNNNVNDIVAQADGKIIVAGPFTSLGQTGGSVTVNRVARLTTAGAVDATFAVGTGLNSQALTVALYQTTAADDTVLVGGQFTTFNNATHGPVVRLTSAGAETTPALNPTMVAAAIPNAVAALPNGQFLVAGSFSAVDGVARFNLARYNANGTFDSTYNPGSTGATSINGTVNALAVRGDGKVMIAGGFTTVGGAAAVRVARLNADGTLDGTFNSSVGMSTAPSWILLQPDGKVLVGGPTSFTYNGGVTRTGVVRLLADGSVDPSWVNLNTNGGFNGTILGAAVQSDGRVLVGGQFTTLNGTAQTNLARLLPDGSLDTSFAVGTLNGQVNAILVIPGTPGSESVMIGGAFTTYGGTTRNRVARLTSTGSLDVAFDPGTGANSNVIGFLLQEDGKVLARGSFTSYGPTNANTVGIVRLQSDGTKDPAFGVYGLTISSTVAGLIVQDDGTLLFPGQAIYDNFVARASVAHTVPATARSITTPPQSVTVNEGVSTTLSVVADGTGPLTYQWLKDGSTIAGATSSTLSITNPSREEAGSYSVQVTNLAGTITSPAATLTVNPTPYITSISPSQTVDPQSNFTLYAEIQSVPAPTSVQWLKNGTPIPGATLPSLNIGSFQASDAGTYSLSVTNSVGSSTSLQQSAIVGGWSFTNAGPAHSNGVITFLADGRFFLAEDGDATADPSGHDGMERGFYTWNPGSGEYTMNVRSDTNGGWGFAHMTGASTITVSGTTLTAGSVTFTRVTNASNPAVGSFAGGDALGQACITFFADGTYFMAEDGAPDAGGGPGMERGTYTYDAGTGAFTATATVDTSGDRGASGAVGTVKFFGNTMVFMDQDTTRLDRVVPTATTLTLSSKPVITANPVSAAVAVGGSTTLSVTASGTGTLTYQWRRNGANIPGATNATLPVTLNAATDGALFDVVVGSAAGSTVSHAASFVVDSSILDESFTPPQFAGPASGWGEVLSDGSFLVSARIRQSAGTQMSERGAGIARYLADGTPDAAFKTKYPAEYGSLASRVLAVSGKFYAAVDTSRYLGTTAKATIARFFNDGTLDGSFAPYTFDPGSTENNVTGFVLQTDGKLIVSGQFTNVNGTGRSGLFRLNTDGSLDTSFVVTTFSGGRGLYATPRVDSNGKILVAGEFNNFNGTASTVGIVRLNADGSRDSTFTAAGFTTSFGAIRGLMIQSTGKIVLGGRFTVNGVGLIPFIRLNADGSLDSTFSTFTVSKPSFINADLLPLPGDKFAGSPMDMVVCNADGTRVPASEFTSPVRYDITDPSESSNTGVSQIRLRADGSYLIGGNFSHLNGVAVPRVAILSANGTVQSTSIDGMGTTVLPLTFVRTANGHTIGGYSTYVAGVSNTNGIMFDLQANGSVATTPFSTALSSGGFYFSFARVGDGRIFVIAEDYAQNRFFRRLLPDGSVDSSLTTTAAPAGGPNPDFAFVQPDFKTLITARFPEDQEIVNGENLRRLNVDGSLDTGYTAELDQVATPARGTPLSGESVGPLQSVTRLGIEVLAVDASNRAYVRYPATGGVTRLARLNANGSRDTTFAIVTAPTIVGTYTSQSVTDPLRPTASPATVTVNTASRREFLDVVVQASGKIVIAGNFKSLTIDGTTTNQPGLARLNANGSLDTTFNSGNAGPAWTTTPVTSTDFPAVEAMVQQADGRILLAGNFEAYNGMPAPGLVRINPNGTYDPTFVSPVARSLRYSAWPEMQMQDDGSILLMGGYVVPGERFARGIVRLTIDGAAPTITQQPAPATVIAGGEVTLSVAPAGPGPFTYQWRLGNTDVPGATGPTLTLSNIQPAKYGDYSVVISNPFSSVTSSPATVAAAPGTSAYASTTFTRPEFRRAVIPGRTTYGAVSGKIYATFVNGNYLSGANHQRVGAVIRLNDNDGVDSSFNTGPFLTDAWAVIEQADGKVLVGGLASHENNISGPANYRMWRFLSNGSVDPTYKSPILEAIPRYVALQPDGKLLVAGGGNSTGNGGVHSALFRLNTDGSKDQSFTDPVLTPSPAGGAVVFASILVDSQSRVIFGGSFAGVNGVTRAGVARLLPDGTLDSTFVPSGYTPNGGIQVRGLGLQTVGANAGKILVAGTAFNVGGTNHNLIRLNANGSLDAGFTRQTNGSLGIPSGRPRLLNVLPDDKFTIVSNSVTRLLADGAIDVAYTRPQLSSESFWMQTLADGRVILNPELGMTVNGTPVSTLVRFTDTGAVDGTFTPGQFQAEAYPEDGALLANGKLLTWGNFDTVGTTPRRGAARFNADGTLDAGFNISEIPNLVGIPEAFVQPDGSLIASTLVGASVQTATGGLTKLDSNGAVVGSFVVDASILAAAQTGSFDLFGQPDGKVIVTSQSGQRVLDGGAFVKRMNPDGSLDPFTGPTGAIGAVFRDVGGNITSVTTGGFKVLGRYPDGRLIAAMTAAPYTAEPTSMNWTLVRLSATGEVDGTFNAPLVPSPTSSSFPTLTDRVPEPDVTQQFLEYSSEEVFRGVLPQADGSVIVYGGFSTIGGQPAPGIARLTNLGLFDGTFSVGSGPESRSQPGRQAGVGGVTIDSAGRYWITGLFDTFGGRAAPGIVRLNANGTVDPTFATSIGFQPYIGGLTKTLLRSDNEAVVFGTFARSNDPFPNAINSILVPAPAGFGPLPPAQILTSGQSVTLSTTVQGVPAPALQWRKNGANISGANGPSYNIATLGTGDTGVYDVTGTNFYGSATSQGSLVTVAAAGGDTFPNFAWRNPLPAGGTLRGVAWGNGKFVGVGTSGRVVTSTDGSSWTSAANLSGNISLNAVTYNTALNLFVAVGSSGDVYTAAGGDVTTWTKRASNTTDFLVGVAGGTASANNVLVAVGSNGRVITSADGVTWTAQLLSGNPSLMGVAGAADLFVAVGNNGALFTSTNGTAWSAATPATGLTTASFNAVRYLNSQFVAVGNSGAVMTWSGTGAWTAVTGVNRSIRDIAAIGTTYIAATDSAVVVKGTNLAGWQNVNVSPFGVHYGIATNGTVFATVGAGGEIWSSNDATANAWTSRGTAGGFWRFGAVEFLNGKFLAVGSSGAIYTSADGSAWKRESVPTGAWLNSAAYGAGLYIVPTTFGEILTSPDASTWTSRSVGDTVGNNGAAFDGTRFIVVGDNGKIRTSTDGTNWTSVTGTGITAHLRSVAAKVGVIVAVGDSGKIYTSADGATWVERTSNTAQRLWRVRLIEGTFFAVGESRTVLASTDGITWVPLPITNSIGFAYRDIQRLSDGFYITADTGLLVKTADLLTATSVGNVAASETLNGLAVGAGRVVVVGEGGSLLESVLPAANATPQITVQPAGVTTDATKNVVLAVVANASGPITYQWKQGTTNVPGGTSSTLLIPAAATSASGSYTVVVTSGANSVTSNAAVVTVNALAAPAITALPIGAQAVTGGASMSVTATGTAPLTYQWYRGLSGDTSTPVSTNASFTTSALNQSERYWVKITNFANQVLNSPTTTAVAITPRNGPLAGASVTGIAYSGSKYAAVAGPSILTSADGVTWTRLTGLTGSFLTQIAYGNSTFVAVGNSGAIRTSTDNGVTWVSSTFGSIGFNGVCFDGTQFVAVGNSGVVATSTNGTNWTSRTALSGTPTMRAITVANGVYIAVGDAGIIQTSDGLYNGGTQPAWTVRASSTGNNFRSVSANGVTSATIVAVGDSGTIRVSTNTSTSGSSWTIANSPAGNSVNAVTFANGKFIAAAGSQFFTSTDGSNWGTTTSSILPLGNLGANVIVYAGGQYLIGAYPGAIITSTTGAVDTWTLRTGGTAALFTNVIHGGGVYLGVGNSGAIGRSADGASFNVKSPVVAGLDFVTLRRAAHGKGTFVVVGDSGTILSSPDGQLWIQRASGGSAYLAATYGNNKFVVAGGGGTFASSADGATWTPGAGTIGTANVTALAFGSGVYVAVNTTGGIYTSTDALTWTSRTSGVSTSLNNVAFAGGQFVAVGAASVVLTSPDGITWTPRSLGTASMTLTGIAYGDGMYLATHADNSNTSLLFLSPDAVTWNSANVGGGIVNGFSSTTVAFGNGAFLIAGGNALLAQTVPAADVPRITVQPASQGITGGQTVTLSVAAVGSSPTYQWYEGATGDVSLPVGTNATYTTPSLLQSKRYWVRVTAGGQTFESDTAQLLGPPAIISAPTSRMVNDGTVLTLSVNAIGAAPLSYVWKYNNTNIPGANGPTYTLNPVSLSNAGNYSVAVSNAAGIASTSPAAISVAPVAPTVGGIASTFGRNVPVGANTELSVAVSGTPTLTYQWRRNNTAIPGATKSTYFITNAKATDSGTYSVVVTNAQGNGTSSDFGLSVTPELGWQWRNPLPTGNGLSSVTAINNKFYLGGLRSTMLVSDNGTTWTPRAVSGTGNLFGMAYGAGRFVALGGLNAIYTSEDGNIWTPRDSKVQDTNSLQTIAFGAGRFVAVGFNGRTTTSTDGINWTPGQVPTTVANDYLYWIRYVQGKFWVSSSDDNTVRTWTSTDGLTWMQPALTLPPNMFIGQVEFGNGIYVATTDGDFLWSSDGVTWSAAGFGPLGQDMPKVRYVNDRFVAVSTDGTIATSTNGQTWTQQVSGVTVGLSDVAFANGVYVISGGVPRVILTSPDAVNWTQVVSGPSQTSPLLAVATGAGKLVAVGNSGTIVTSSDGVAWTAPTSGVANNLFDVTYGAGVFVAVGAGGRVMTASDTALDTWTSRTSNTSANLRRVSYGNGRFLAVSDSGASIVSTDGITWTANASTLGSFFGTAYGAGVQVAVGNSGGLFSSADNGATWTNRAGSLVNTGYSDVLFANGKFVTVGLAGVAATSSDGITWTQVTPFTSDNLNGLVFTSGYWIATGASSTYYVSTDGVTWSPRYTGAQDSLRDFAVYGNQVIGVGNNGTIIASGAPVFFSPPVPTSARAGGNVTLSALVGGSPIPVSYQWQKDGANISDGAGISGTTTPTLTLTNVAIGAAGQYRLIATNAIAPTTSAAVALTVSQAPVFTSQPANSTAVAGQSASFTAAAVGTPTPTYQWQKDNVNIANGTLPNGTVVAGATTGTLILSNVQPEAVGSYRLIATNLPAGESTPVSEPSLPATLTVNVLPAPAIASAVPAIASGEVTLTAGDNALDDVTFTATATGTAPLNYQWRRNGFNLANGTFVSGATTNTLTLSNVPLNGGGAITVAVTNAAGTVVSAPVSLVVNPPAPVINSPLSVSGVVNTPFTYGIGVNNTTATYGATNLPAGLTINTGTGVISGIPTAMGVFNTVAISATNVSGTDTKTLTITINPPPPIITSPVAATGRVNQGTPLSYTIVATNTPTGITATPLPPGLSLSGNVISGTPTQAGTFTTTITATNATGSATQTVVFTIDPALNAPVYTGSTQPSGTQNSAFTFAPAFTNVNPTNGYAITSGTLPAGITLNANTGALTGTPTAVGTFPVTLTATGPGGSLGVVLTIVINPAPSAPVVTSPASASGSAGQPFSYTITTDVAATSYTAVVLTGTGTEALPGWLSLSSNVLSGTPPAAGSFSLLVSATGSGLTGPGKLVVVTINPSPLAPVITSSPFVSNATTGRVGEMTTSGSPLYLIEATNSPTSFERTAGPTFESFGLQLEAGTGKVFGTPTAAGTFKVWLAASNVAGGRGPSLEVTFVIQPALNVPVITSNGTAAGQVGQSFSYAISATNAPTSVSDTGLPANGLTRNGNLISGIPTTATVTPLVITVSAANADGSSSPKTVSITIAPAPATPVITSAGTASGRVASTFSYQMTASESPTSFSAVNLPPGLAVNPTTGAISGTPTQAGTFTATLSAANAAGLGVTSPLVFSIAPAPAAPAITSAPSASGKVGVAFSYTTTATNGPITNFAVNGTLPAGLGLNTSTGVISGTPVEPGFKVVDLTATSANGTSLPQSLIIVVDPADNVPVITSPIYSIGTVGSDFSYAIAATNMPASSPFPAAVTLDAVGLPAGLAVNPSTGVIQGQPTVAGVFVATLVGTNEAGTGPSRSLTIFVQPAATAPTVTSSSTAAGQVGTGFSYQIAATNSPLGYEVLGAPAWMTVNGQSGAIGGTPTTPGTFVVLLVASNSAGASNPAPLTLLIAAAANTPVVTSTRNASGTMSSAFSYTIQASNTPTSYFASGLPAGLTLNSTTGAITGTPSASGTYQVTISGNNANGAGQPVILTLTIAPNLQIAL